MLTRHVKAYTVLVQ